MIRKKTGKFMTVLLGAALLGTAAFASGCSSAQPDSQEDGTVVAHVGENPVYLDEAEFYTRMLQEQWEAAYYPVSYTHLSGIRETSVFAA